jgi:hypothetical protein
MSLVFNAINARAITANLDINTPSRYWSRWWGEDTIDPWDDGVLWPQSNLPGGSTGILEAQRFEPPVRTWGNSCMKKVIGITRDSNGATLGSAHVDLFLTSNDTLVVDLTSDAGGYFEACTQFAGVNHYLVAYKAGSPDVAGTTKNTLVPS